MIIYKDLVYENELFTDAYKPKMMDDGSECFTWNSQQVTRKEGQIDDRLIGGNASAEEAAEETETQTKSGFDFELDGNLEAQDWQRGKKDFQEWIKIYAKKVIAKLEATNADKVDDTKASAKKFIEKVTGFFKEKKDLSFYSGPGNDDDDHGFVIGNIIVLVWNDDGMSGTAFCWAGGLKQEKV